MKGINERYNIIIDELGLMGSLFIYFAGARPTVQPQSGAAK